MTKPTFATVSLGGCEGCHVALLDAHEGLLDLLGEVDYVYGPYSGLDEFPNSVDVAMVEGAVQTEEDRERVRKVRAAAKVVVAIGSCAVLGGIGGLRNLSSRSEVLEQAYGTDASLKNTDGLPGLIDRCRPVTDFIDVEYSMAGCAPETPGLVACLKTAIAGAEFAPPRRNLCDECPRVKDKLLEHTQEFISDNVYALMELETIDPKACFLEQGVMCMGPMTREGCGAKCTTAGVPCRGCYGPSRLDYEQGGKAVDALAAVLPAGALMYLEDLIGTGYRFSMPVSVFPAIYEHGSEGGERNE